MSPAPSLIQRLLRCLVLRLALLLGGRIGARIVGLRLEMAGLVEGSKRREWLAREIARRLHGHVGGETDLCPDGKVAVLLEEAASSVSLKSVSCSLLATGGALVLERLARRAVEEACAAACSNRHEAGSFAPGRGAKREACSSRNRMENVAYWSP